MSGLTFSDLLRALDPRPDVRFREFERICRWLLLNAPEYRARIRSVWLWSDWPGAWGRDAGIDLVAEEHDGGLWAIQAKLYDPAYAIKKADVDSFLSESARGDFAYRLLIATTDRLGPTARKTLDGQRQPVGYLLRSQLDRAPVMWPASSANLRSRRPTRKTPLPHVREAVKATVKGFARNDRGQLLMACGTGKTLAGLWVSERMKSNRALVLVPSLSLLAQTLREWSANAAGSFDYLAVCSDQTVTGEDGMVQHTSELGLPATTDPHMIAAFLRRRGRRVVFATYQSSPRIGEAYALGRVPKLNLTIADEAHRCAGRVSSDFAMILDAGAIPAERRLFMTATPRYFTGRVVQEAKEAEFEVASMDDPDTFGPVLHRLSFGEAIDRDLLSDYQVAVIGVDDATYREWAEHGRFVTIDGTGVTDARSLAGQIGLAKAMRRYRLRRTISFHSRVARARDFARSLIEVVRWMPTDQRPEGSLWAQHVSGEMTTAERTIGLERLRHLDDGAVGLLANARCLAEGVDVPTLDGVAFVDPRRSEVDIIQAVGRAIRKAENKTKGTIVIPVFIGTDEDPEAALNDSAFRPVWDVIRALRAHDTDLAEQLDSLRRELGKGALSVVIPPKIHLDLPARIGSDFASAFEVRLVERTTSKWEFGLGLLEAFADQEGHCRVPRRHVVKGFNLGVWCNNRRFDRKRGALDPECVAALDALGFVWDPFQEAFDRGIAELAAYVQTHGDARVPDKYTTSSGFKLGSWCQGHRGDRKTAKLSIERVAALDALGFVWDPLADDFDRGLAELTAYVEANGDARVSPKHTTSTGYKLGGWCDRRRQERKENTLTMRKIAALDALGFAWDPFQEAFDRGLDELAAYVAVHGDARVPQAYSTLSGFKLGVWCAGRRGDRKAGKLAVERIAALDALGLVWDVLEDDFNRGLAELSIYVSAHGDARVPQRHMTSAGLPLGSWCSSRRTDRKTGKLDPERIAALDALGFVWNTLQDAFDRGLAELAAYVQAHGDARPPNGYKTPSGFNLRAWCANRRTERKAGTLSADRIAALNALGFAWDQLQDDFDRGLAELAAYVEAHGDARVPAAHSTPSSFRLGTWCRNRRKEREVGRLDAERISALDALGFVWNPRREVFARGLAELALYIETHGDAHVPATHKMPSGFNLGAWCYTRRKERIGGRLTTERVAELDALGFVWDTTQVAPQGTK